MAAQTIQDAEEPLQVNSNKIPDMLAQSATDLASVRHLRLTSTPGDDLAEEDFAGRVGSLLRTTTSLVSLTICIPTMARLHPSNSLPKVLDILHDASLQHPQCRLGLVVHEAEQTWGALTILNRIVDLHVKLYSIELSRAFLPVEALIQAAQSCGLASLTLHATQVFSSPIDTSTINDNGVSIPTLTSLTVHAHSETSPGLDLLLLTAASTLDHLELSSTSSESGISLQGRDFPRLAQFTLHEDLLVESTGARMPGLKDLTVPLLTRVDNCNAILQILQSTPGVQHVRVLRVEAGDASEGLTRLAEAHPSIAMTIGELAVRDPTRLTPAALEISEHLVNVGPPIAGDWPLGFGKRQYPRLKSIVLKVHSGHNHEEFIASLNAPNLRSPPSISLIGKKKGKVGKK